MRFCLCCGTTAETPSISACWPHWQLLPEDLRSSIVRTSARGQLTLYAQAATEAIAVWREAGAWRPKQHAAELQQKSNVMPLALLRRLIRSDYRNSCKELADDQPRHHDPRAWISADARPAAEDSGLDIAVVRALPRSRATQTRTIDPALARGHTESLALRPLHARAALSQG